MGKKRVALRLPHLPRLPLAPTRWIFRPSKKPSSTLGSFEEAEGLSHVKLSSRRWAGSFGAVTSENAGGRFDHCGYAIARLLRKPLKGENGTVERIVAVAWAAPNRRYMPSSSDA